MSAANWIKLQINIWEKGEVQYIADACGIPIELAVGILCRVWCWFDQHTESGEANKFENRVVERIAETPVTLWRDHCHANDKTSHTDASVRHTTFLQAMADTDWLEKTEDGNWRLVDWEKHNGATGKKRAGSQKRKQNQREREEKERLSHVESEPVTLERDQPVTREEKRREENTMAKSDDLSLALDDDGFEAWYKAFPNKKKKQEAHRAWKKLTKVERQKALEILPTFNTYKEQTKEAMPYPASFLNGKRWNDDLTVPTFNGHTTKPMQQGVQYAPAGKLQ